MVITKEISDTLHSISRRYGGDIAFNCSFARHSTIGIGGNVSVWYIPSSIEELREVLCFLSGSGVRFMVVGMCSNMLFPDEGLDAVILSLSSVFFRRIDIANNIVSAGAGATIGNLVTKCCENGLAGLEGLVGIPAAVGGALRMNASYKSAVSERLLRVFVMDDKGKTEWLEKNDIDFGYRFSSLDRKKIILEALFFLDKSSSVDLKNRVKCFYDEKKEKQPLDKKTLGCIFKNPDRSLFTAGELIEKSGMKGVFQGSAKVSEKHANFIINTGKALSSDVRILISKIRIEVRKNFPVDITPEIEIL